MTATATETLGFQAEVRELLKLLIHSLIQPQGNLPPAYVLPQDVLDMAMDVIRHRLVLSYEALSDNISSDDILKKIFDRIPLPVVPLHEHFNVHANA